MFFNVDGEQEQPWGQQPESFYNGGQFFGCLLGDCGCGVESEPDEDDLVCLPCDWDDESECGDDLMMMTGEEIDEAEVTVSPVKKFATFAELLEYHNKNKKTREEAPITPKKNPAVSFPKKRRERECRQ